MNHTTESDSIKLRPSTPQKSQKLSLYLNAERSAYLAQWMAKNPSCTTPIEALYLLLDSWAMDTGQKPVPVLNEELTDIRRALSHLAAVQEGVAVKNTEALVQMAKAMGRLAGPSSQALSTAHALTPSATSKAPVSANTDSGGLSPTLIHRSLLDWLLDTLTRVSGHGASKILASLKPSPSTDGAQSSCFRTEVLSVEGVALSGRIASAIDRAAFTGPLPQDDSMYLVCQRTDGHTWMAQVRVKDPAIKTGRLVLNQEIKH